MYRNQSNTLQYFGRLVRQVIVGTPRSYATKQSKISSSKNSNSDEFSSSPELRASFYANNLGEYNCVYVLILFC